MIELNLNQITTLQDFQRDQNYPDAYRYLRDIVRDLQNNAGTLEQAREYESLQNWFDTAAKINADDGSFASEVVRGSTEGFAESSGITI
jgi:trimeric autotransporter adhesin